MLSARDAQVARDFATRAAVANQRFSKSFLTHVESAYADDKSIREGWRLEAHAALWASTLAAVEWTDLDSDFQVAYITALQDIMCPYWEESCAPEPDAARQIESISHKYSDLRVVGHAADTAGNIVGALMDSAGAAVQSRSFVGRLLATLLTCNMVAELRKLSFMASILVPTP